MAFKIENNILIKYFAEAGVTDVAVPDGVTAVDDYAFKNCNSLKSVTIPDSVTEI